MAAKVKEETVKSPGTLVISGYVGTPDITKTVTPDIKYPGQSQLVLIDLAPGHSRLGASALAQTFNNLGNDSPDVDDVILLKNAFNAIQQCIDNRLLAAGHDRSDGGLVTTLLEMCFAGNCGMDIKINTDKPIDYLFAEELGLVIEIQDSHFDNVMKLLANLPLVVLGRSTLQKQIKIHTTKDVQVLNEDMTLLRDLWNATSFELELLQANPHCVQVENTKLKVKNYRNIY